jgi:oligopeptide transport system substrate-binding protein
MRLNSRLAPLFAIALLASGLFVSAAAPAGPAAASPAPVSGFAPVRQADGSVVIDATPAATVATPKGEQKLTIAVSLTDLPTLDPALARDSDSSFLDRQLFAGLVQFDDSLKPAPGIANRIEISADGLRYTFQINPTAAFQDGTRITADDVVYSLSRAVDPATSGGDLSALAGPTFLANIKGYDAVSTGAATALAGVSAVDDDHLTIDLVEPDSAFLMKLASTAASVVDKRDVDRGGDWSFHPNGSGPFQISEYVAQDHLTLAPNEHYFAGPPALQTVTVLLGSRALSPFNLYQVGSVDIASVGLSGIDRVLAPEAGYIDQLRKTTLFSLDFIAFNPNQTPMNDPEIRKAVALAFPSAKVADITLNGHAVAAKGVIPDGMLGQNWVGVVEPNDIAAAKDAIAKSSYGSADKVPPIQIYLSGGGTAESLRDSLAETVGLKVEVISMEWPDFISGLSQKSLPAFELYWTADFPDPESILAVLFGTGRPDNYLNYSNPKMDALLKQASAEIDPAKRADLYAQAQQLLIDDHVVIPVTFDVGYTLVNPAVKGLTITPMGIISLASVWMEH